ncbi:unnamed protein product [Lymnaea stagnalis]|uniref:Micro-fibrillar-associated protein 1 C-terminal domain-containing protein n=1 Tax=Lymnaea stagnalis TaxID=6523 RepID=A0AAV2H7K6_LYMST
MSKGKVPIMSTAGAIPVRNEKGKLTMEKVKVTRYMRGQRPEFAPESDDEEEVEVTTGFQSRVRAPQVDDRKEDDDEIEKESQEVQDRRLRRLQHRERQDIILIPLYLEIELLQPQALKLHLYVALLLGKATLANNYHNNVILLTCFLSRVTRHRREVVEPEVIAEGSDDESRPIRRRRADDSSEGEEDEEEEEEDEEESEEESSEYEEYTDSEEEAGPRLKPVFVRKKDRITVQEREREEARTKELEVEAKKLAEERKRQTIKMANQEMKRELEEEKSLQQACDGIDSDEDNDEEEYEVWKVRELKRIKRDREEREATDKEKMEVERLRNMTEEERRQELRQNPKQVINKAPKGKYKFLQKYYHRGAFFLDKDDQVFKQDFSQPTLEDHFDKTILPKVMQVKNFGRSGRTKYTHLLDQDTTQKNETPWIQDTAQNLKFHTARGGGMKQQFDRPSAKVKK